MSRMRGWLLGLALSPAIAVAGVRPARADEPQDFTEDPVVAKRSFVGRSSRGPTSRRGRHRGRLHPARLAGANFRGAILVEASLWEADLTARTWRSPS